MSEPIRYNIEKLNCCFDADMIESKTGEYVLHSDYARLDDENVRLRKMLYDFVDAYEEGQLDALLFVIRQTSNKDGETSV